jgi:hypothetical protein
VEPIDNPKKLDQSFEIQPMDQQGEGLDDAAVGVRHEKLTFGDDCVFVNVSTNKERVVGRDIRTGDRTVIHGGQMSDDSLQGLPTSQGAPISDSTAEQCVEDEFANRHGTGHMLEQGESTSARASHST